MAPRKNCDSSNKITKKKIIKAKVEKPKLKTPTTITVKIPIATDPVNSTVKALARKISLQQKIDLANEVALQQLRKDVVIKEEPPTQVKPVGRKKAVKKPQAMKKTMDVKKPVTVKKTKAVKKTPSAKNNPAKIVSNFFASDTICSTSNEVPIKSLADSTMKIKKNIVKTNSGLMKKPQNTKVVKKKVALKRKGKPVKAPDVVPLPSEFTIKNETDSMPNKKAELIHSRTSSLNSNSSLSWTRDISSSSTTTCLTVSSKEIVRFDKKMPIVQLNTIDDIIQQKNTIPSSSESEQSDGKSDNQFSDSLIDNLAVQNSLNLSVSSVTDKMTDEPLSVLLGQLQSTRKCIDDQFASWIGSKNLVVEDINHEKYTNILKTMPSERRVVEECNKLLEILNDNGNKINREKRDVYILKPDNISTYDKDIDIYKTPAFQTQICSPIVDSDLATLDSDTICEDNVNYTSFETFKSADADLDPDPDADVLSIFAESIDLDSCRFNSSTQALTSMSGCHEEYIPKKINNNVEQYTYCPTAIPPDTQKILSCEKQKADSTVTMDTASNHPQPESTLENNYTPSRGLYRQGEIGLYRQGEIGLYRQFLNNFNKAHTSTQPALISCVFKPMQDVQSMLFKNVCLLFINGKCTTINCSYRHQMPDPAYTEELLTTFSDDTFIQEYMLIRNSHSLRRKYGLCFVNECINRRLTRVLVEMGIDFLMKTDFNSVEDRESKNTILELTLMHLNTVNLEFCKDLLRSKVFCKDRTLLFYEVLLQVIADTQNFARFKIVFVNLVHMVVQDKGSFELEVVNKIMERVCILPCDESLAHAMMFAIQLTDRKIFENTNLAKFEVLLRNLGENVLDSFLRMKESCKSPLSPQQEMLNTTPLAHVNLPECQLPVTASFDSLNNPTKGIKNQTITRTVDFKRPQASTPMRRFPSKMPHRFMNDYNSWRAPRPPYPRMMWPPMRHGRPPWHMGVIRHANERHITIQPPRYYRRQEPEF